MMKVARNALRWITGRPLWLLLPVMLLVAFLLVGFICWQTLVHLKHGQIERDIRNATRYRTNLVQAFWIDAILSSDRPLIDNGLKALGASDPNIHRLEIRGRDGTMLGDWRRSSDVDLMRPGNLVNTEEIQFDGRTVGHFTIEWDTSPIRESRLTGMAQLFRWFVIGSVSLIGLVMLINHFLLIRPLRHLMQKVARLRTDPEALPDALPDPSVMPGELRRLSSTIEETEVLLIGQTQQKLDLAAAENKQRAAEESAMEKANFLSTMSHEIRTPLTAILGYADMMDGTPLATEDQEGLQMIIKSGLHLKRITDDILDFSKLDVKRLALSPEPFRIREFLQEAILTETPRAEKRNVELLLEIPSETPPIINTDRVRLKQVLLNLLSNAVKFTQHGTVTVRTVPVPPRPPTNGSDAPRTMICIEVEDTGAGIPEESLDSVFLPFSQVDVRRDRDRGGAGLGLAISQKLVGLMGGNIEVESTLGVGTTMRLAIFADMKGERKKTTSGSYDRSLGERVPHNILLAEDNPVNQRLLMQTFKRFGYKPVVVSDGQAALDALASSKADQRFTIAFIDLNMPVMDGITAIKSIRDGLAGDHYRNLPVSALTADVLASTEWRDWGFDEYLLKPLEKEKICRFLERSQRLGEAETRMNGASTSRPASS